MEPALRRATLTLCGRCSAPLRRQAGSKTYEVSVAAGRPRVSNRRITNARAFTTSPRSKTEAVAAADGTSPSTSVLLKPDNLFHPFSSSPVAEFRRRAAFMRQQAYCPHPDHQLTRLPTVGPAPGRDGGEGGRKMAPAHVDFECPDCGLPVYCSKEHWMDHYDEHLKICDTLRQINEDDHDLRSGRVFHEANLPDFQLEEAAVNMTSWDTFMYTREFRAVDSDRSMRQITRLLTYPVTIGSVLHELSPYDFKTGKRLTVEGLKSLSALRYNLHPPKNGRGFSVRELKPEPPAMRIFILGARAESSLPRPIWVQLAHLFPATRLHLVFIGPESMANRDDEFPLPKRTASNPFGAVVEDRVWYQMKISTIVDYYHTIHKTGYFAPYDPYFDCFVLFHPGLGHPASSHEWEETLPMLLETKVPIISTGYTQFDMERDIDWVKKQSKGEFDVLLEPGENLFRSLRWDLNDMDPQDVSCGNWGPGPAMSVVAPRETESDRATQALVRRTLCPQQTRDKETQLPPLTSRNDVDVELYALLAIVLREYVQRWYGSMTTDETFVAEIVHVVAHCSRALEQRIRKLDLVSLLFDELPQLLDQHVSAYRAAQDSLVRPPLVIDLHQAYHALCPFPPLDADQRESEADYRQLLVYAVLAVLLPTEDLENPCLTALVGQIFSELVIGNLIIGKAAQPWLILEGICILAHNQEKKSPSPKEDVSAQSPAIQVWLQSMAKMALALLSWIWILVGALATSSSLPPRRSCASSPRVKTPVLEFAAWRCAGNLLQLGSRMPWLEGFLSLARFGAVHGPGHVAGVDGAVDRSVG
ncbi:hypothetical protein CP532_4388 [Ophiocordyceps camponoti-leonardi (nom. inval.)]|nr:hypothetical protein CP532_4388 [Ophiocordyceps camponoti-leonardi (nom. inval.)]